MSDLSRNNKGLAPAVKKWPVPGLFCARAVPLRAAFKSETAVTKEEGGGESRGPSCDNLTP